MLQDPSDVVKAIEQFSATTANQPLSAPVKDTLTRLLGSLEGLTLRPSGDGWQALCPAHPDTNPSLSVSLGRAGNVLLHCHAGCSTRAVLESIGMTMHELGNGREPRSSARRPVKEYSYRDADGVLRHQTVRFEPKDFRQRRPDPGGGWIWNLNGIEPLLYRLPELLAADPKLPVFIAEGEKGVEALVGLGLVATCSPLGAGKWRPSYAEHLRGRSVVILPDNDVPGARHAEKVAASLTGVAAVVRVLALPGLPRGGDPFDYVAAGGGKDALLAMAASLSPWKPPTVTESPSAPGIDVGIVEHECFADQTLRPIRWLVPDLFALGYLSIIAGKGDNLKSTLTYSLAASVTTGTSAFGLDYQPRPPGEVLFANQEDGVRDVMLPRLLAAGADLQLCRFITGVRYKNGSRESFNLTRAEALAACLEERPSTRLIVIDPASAFCAGVDDHRDSAIRGLLGPLSDVAQRYAAAIVLVKHINKATGVKGSDRVSGSVGWWNACRNVFLVVPDPDGEAERRRLFLPNKNNLSSRKVGFSFKPISLPEIESRAVLARFPDLDDEDRAGLAQQLFRLEWLGTSDANPDDLLASESRIQRPPNRVECCQEWLRYYLGDYAHPDTEVMAAAEKAGFNSRLAERGKTALRNQGALLSRRDGFRGAFWTGHPDALAGAPSEWKRRPTPGDDLPPPLDQPRQPTPPIGDISEIGDVGDVGEQEGSQPRQPSSSPGQYGDVGDVGDVGEQGKTPDGGRQPDQPHQPHPHYCSVGEVGDVGQVGQVVFIDLETRSRAALKKVGGRRYACDPETSILTVAALLNSRVVLWSPLFPPPASITWPDGFGPIRPIEIYGARDLPPPLAQALSSGATFVAHNASGFDALVWDAQRLPTPLRWRDTLLDARAAGLPGALDKLAQWLYGRGKDKAGDRLIKQYCSPVKKTGVFREPSPDDLAALLTYNLVDVLLTEAIASRVAGKAEADVVRIDEAINYRGIHFDVGLAKALIRLEADWLSEFQAHVATASGGEVKATDLNRRDFLLNWLNERRGLQIPDLKKATVAELLARQEPLDPAVRAVLEARAAQAHVTTKKLKQALISCWPDGRLRDQLRYYGSHTGRWSANGVQLQNLPRPHNGLKIEHYESLIQAANAGDLAAFRSTLPTDVSVADALGSLCRPCFRATPGTTLLVADYAGVEARGLAWLAGEQKLIRQFEAGADVYLDFASRIFGRPITGKGPERHLAKVAILGLGYQMGAARFETLANGAGLDLAAVGLDAPAVVAAYRETYPAIAGRMRPNGLGRQDGLWQRLETAAKKVITEQAKAAITARCRFEQDRDGSLVITLPSGRKLYYPNSRVTAEEDGRVSLLYDGLRPSSAKGSAKAGVAPGSYAASTYGGLLAENVTQAVCRDLLANSLLLCERHGLDVVLHVHDEIVCEVEECHASDALLRLAVIMSTPPSWAEGFPLEVEAFATTRYAKAPSPGTPILKARCGKTLT